MQVTTCILYFYMIRVNKQSLSRHTSFPIQADFPMKKKILQNAAKPNFYDDIFPYDRIPAIPLTEKYMRRLTEE